MFCSALVFLMTPALALFYGGMVRRKNVLNTMMSTFILCGVASVLWVFIGYSLSFGNDMGHILGGVNHLFFSGVGMEPSKYAGSIPSLLFATFQMMFAIIAPALIAGALVERMKFSAVVLFMILWSFIVYYPLAHMIWGEGGFLKNLGVIDFAGGYVIHVSSGVSALVAAIMLGKRREHGMASYHPHNIPMIFIGAGLLWFGWFGFNAGSAYNSGYQAIHAFIVTNTSGACGMLSWLIIEKVTRGKPTMLGAATGAVVGLATITQGSGFVPIWAAMIIGTLASPICYFALSVVKAKFGYDDSLDVFGCHGVGGIWGGIATGIFSVTKVYGSSTGARWNGLIFGEFQLFGVQIAGLLVTVLLSVAGTALIMLVLKAVMKIRVSTKEEADGLDLAEHGESAYPSFTGMDS
ncbi:MAG: ammonia permease [Clostridiales bacterium 43-6]|nr:MAG: ammonia permease [Clostridiales bacterium 43-6]